MADTTKNGLPWWGDLILKAGIPAAIGAYAFWWVTNTQSDRLLAVESEIRSHTRAVQALVVEIDGTKDLLGMHHMISERMLMVLIQQCVQQAQTRDDRSACVRAGTGVP